MKYFRITHTKTGISEVVPANRLKDALIIYGIRLEDCEKEPAQAKTRGRVRKCLRRLVGCFKKRSKPTGDIQHKDLMRTTEIGDKEKDNER